ncbi:MAG: ABC transporter ATP-binding protein [Erysipelotrichaceae bacterium]|nr:ABC transporter ATP-binding protein [Erysipelotrichaceae bacterium]MBQ6492333.1 ABC transporter ATP-binding protein [Erysipelotrichaceae bacterium]
MIEIKNASFRYPNGFVALENINLTIKEGEKVAIVGQNGAGKTTCVKMMNGLNRPFEGDVIIDGVNTKEVTVATVARKVGYVFQNPDEQIFNSTARKEIEFMPRYYKLSEEEVKQRVDHAVEICDIAKYMDTNPYEIPYPIRKFVAIAAVIASRPKYIVLDEPTAGQDLHGTEVLGKMVDTLTNEGITVLTITHDMEFAVRNFDRIIAMAHKNIICDGTAQDVFWNEEVVADAKIKKPAIGELAKRLGLDGKILFCDELVDRL